MKAIKRSISVLLIAALLACLPAVAFAEQTDTQDALARRYATRTSRTEMLSAATRDTGGNVAIPSVDMDGQTFLIGTTAELELGTYGGHLYQGFKVEIYKGSSIDKIKESDFVEGWTGGILDGATTEILYWDTTGQAAGDYLFVSMIYDSETRTYLSDSFYYAKFSLVNSPTALNSITLRDTKTDAVLTGWKTLEMGSQLSFYTAFSPSDATGSRVKTITSDDPNVVKIQNFGGIITIIPQLPGKTTITVTANEKSAYFGVEVSGEVTLKLTKNFKSVMMGWRTYLTAIVTPESMMKYARLNWTSDNPNVATVDINGMVTPVSPGMATITCSLTYGGVTVSDFCFISVPAEDDPCKYYEDVNRSQWYHEGIDFVLENGLMGSTYALSYIFEPNTKLTRAMVAAILYRIAGSPEPPAYSGIFSDVKEGQWFTASVEWCASNGLASGRGDGRFDPNGKVTRQELAAFMYRLAEFLGQDISGSDDLSDFEDADTVSVWADKNVRWAVSAGLISGKASDGKLYLAPADTAIRAEFASIVMRFMTNSRTAEPIEPGDNPDA